MQQIQLQRDFTLVSKSMLAFFNAKQLIGLITKRQRMHIQVCIDTYMYRFFYHFGTLSCMTRKACIVLTDNIDNKQTVFQQLLKP